jgi:hypothetical protein
VKVPTSIAPPTTAFAAVSKRQSSVGKRDCSLNGALPRVDDAALHHVPNHRPGPTRAESPSPSYLTRAGLLPRGRWLVVFGAVALLVPSTASAHVRSATVAVDYRTRVFAFPAPLRRVIAARVYDSDRAVRLTVAVGHTAVILGYLHEPFVRVTLGGVEVKASAPTAGGAGLTTRLPRHAVGWQGLSSGRSVTWHDNRVRALPGGIDRAHWKIPLVVDEQPTWLEGELWRVHAPASWPWLFTGVPFVLVSLLLFFRRRSAVPGAAAVLGIVAAAGMITSGAGFAFDTYASSGKWIEVGNELAFVLVGFAVIARGSPNTRGIAGGALGLLGIGAALAKYPVLLHGVVLSIFPPTVARALVVLTACSAAAAIALGLVVFGDVLDGVEEPVDSEPPW